MKKIHVAVAVIEFDNQFLLGFRNEKQHQGNRYEFIGGKIDNNESPKSALIREIHEETGVDITDNPIIKMGQIHHDYSDKSVMLHIFKVIFNKSQFDNLQGGTGAENQPIIWVKKEDLLVKKYNLPDANARILEWLTLPNQIIISQELADFDNEKIAKSQENWVDFYANHLPKNTHFYARPKDNRDNNCLVINKLQKLRDDVKILASASDTADLQITPNIVVLTHADFADNFNNLPTNFRYFASCHTLDEIIKINQLSKMHTVLGIFLSPVKLTKTHLSAVPLGFESFAELANQSHVPVFALGGLSPNDCKNAQRYGAYGVSGIRGFL